MKARGERARGCVSRSWLFICTTCALALSTDDRVTLGPRDLSPLGRTPKPPFPASIPGSGNNGLTIGSA